MASYAIVKDSAAYLPRDLLRHYDITVVPLKLTYNNRVYRDGLDITPDQFYGLLSQASKLPVTSHPSVEEFVTVYQKLAETHDGILSIHLSGDYSKTVQAARQAAGQVSIPVDVIDSRSVSMGLGFVVLEAARAREAGASMAEAAAAARALVPRVHIRMLVDTLRYLHMGGRIGAAERWFGAAFDMKPILSVDDGRTGVVEQARGNRAAMEALIEQISLEAGERPLHAGVANARAAQDALWLYDQISLQFNCVELLYGELSPAIGTHVGPGTVGVAYYVD